jgi:hypothetical protein
MNDPEMNTLVIQTATAAGLRVNVDGKMLNDNYTNVMGSFPSLVRFARALLARQPAAIDKQAEAAWAVYWGIGEMRKNSVHFERETAEKVAAQIKSNTEIRPLYAAPLANEASKPAAPSVGQDERELIELLRNVCHYADSVCGMLRQGGWPGKAEALESRIKAVIDFDANSRDKETNLPCPICNGVEGCDHTVPERARAASTSANVAQGAEPSAYRTLLDSLGYPWLPCPICNGTEGCDHSYPERARAALAAPPVQTALTDDARDAIRRETLKEPVAQTELALTDDEVWQALKDIADLHSHPDDVVQAGRALLTAAQSASGDMK